MNPVTISHRTMSFALFVFLGFLIKVLFKFYILGNTWMNHASTRMRAETQILRVCLNDHFLPHLTIWSTIRMLRLYIHGENQLCVRSGRALSVDGWPLGSIRCCKLGSANSAMDNGSKLEIGKPCSNSMCVCYIHICANTLGNVRIHLLFTQL